MAKYEIKILSTWGLTKLRCPMCLGSEIGMTRRTHDDAVVFTEGEFSLGCASMLDECGFIVETPGFGTIPEVVQSWEDLWESTQATRRKNCRLTGRVRDGIT